MIAHRLSKYYPYKQELIPSNTAPKQVTIKISFKRFNYIFVAALRLRPLVHIALFQLLLVGLLIPTLPNSFMVVALVAFVISGLLTLIISVSSMIDPAKRLTTLGPRLGLLPYLFTAYLVLVIAKMLL